MTLQFATVSVSMLQIKAARIIVTKAKARITQVITVVDQTSKTTDSLK